MADDVKITCCSEINSDIKVRIEIVLLVFNHAAFCYSQVSHIHGVTQAFVTCR